MALEKTGCGKRICLSAFSDAQKSTSLSETPRGKPTGHLLRSSKQLRRPLLNLTMMLYIFINDLPRHTVSDCSSEVSIFPKLARPKLFFDARELAEQCSRTYAFYYPNHLTYRTLRWKRYQQMHMINSYFHFLNLYSVFIAYFFYKLFRSLPYRFVLKYLLPIFRAPYQMVCRVVDRMTRPLQSHASCYNIITQGPMWIRETSRLPYNPLGKACIHPRGKPTGDSAKSLLNDCFAYKRIQIFTVPCFFRNAHCSTQHVVLICASSPRL
jgi:hypothetical protein